MYIPATPEQAHGAAAGRTNALSVVAKQQRTLRLIESLVLKKMFLSDDVACCQESRLNQVYAVVFNDSQNLSYCASPLSKLIRCGGASDLPTIGT
jgi:hypothetical protein